MGSIVRLQDGITEPNVGTIKLYSLKDTNFQKPLIITDSIAQEGLVAFDTFTYKESPTRANDGRLNDLNAYDGFYPAQCIVNLKYINIQDFCNLCDFILLHREFVVEYFDETKGYIIRRQMYITNQERGKLYNRGMLMVGKFDYAITFVGTLNDRDKLYTVKFDANGGTGTISSVTGFAYTPLIIPTSGLSMAGYVLNGFNTKADGTGRHYDLGQDTMVYYNITLFAEWVVA